MHLDLTEVLRGPGHSVERDVAIPAGELDEWTLTEAVTGHISVTNARRNIVVRGNARTSIELECGRCLQPFSYPLTLELDVVVPLGVFNDQLGAAAISDDESDEGNELTREDIAALFSEHHLDVGELVRQAIVLNAPIQALCSAQCQGLPEFQNYRDEPVDPRWAALSSLANEQ